MYAGNQNYILANLGQTLPHNYVNPANPTTHINPRMINMTWLNVTSGEIFTCTDNTPNANVWNGENRTIRSIPSNGLIFEGLSLSGGDIIDSSGNGNDFTGSNVLESYSPCGNNAFNFSYGSSYANGGISLLRVPTSFSFSVWVFRCRIDSSNSTWVFARFDSTSKRCFMLYYPSSTGEIRFAMYSTASDTGSSVTVQHDDLPIGIWNHIVCVHEQNSTNKIYVNGSMSASAAITTYQNVSTTTWIGNYGDSGEKSGIYGGIIAFPRIYNRALTSDECQQLYTECKRY